MTLCVVCVLYSRLHILETLRTVKYLNYANIFVKQSSVQLWIFYIEYK